MQKKVEKLLFSIINPQWIFDDFLTKIFFRNGRKGKWIPLLLFSFHLLASGWWAAFKSCCIKIPSHLEQNVFNFKDVTMITRLFWLAMLVGIVHSGGGQPKLKWVWDSRCKNKHCQENPVRFSCLFLKMPHMELSKTVKMSLGIQYSFYQGQWERCWQLHLEEEIHPNNHIFLPKR